MNTKQILIYLAVFGLGVILAPKVRMIPVVGAKIPSAG